MSRSITCRRRNPTSALTRGHLALPVNIQRSQRCHCGTHASFPSDMQLQSQRSVRTRGALNGLCHPCDTSTAAARMSRSAARGWEQSRYLSSHSCETSETLLCHEFPRTGRVLGGMTRKGTTNAVVRLRRVCAKRVSPLSLVWYCYGFTTG